MTTNAANERRPGGGIEMGRQVTEAEVRAQFSDDLGPAGKFTVEEVFLRDVLLALKADNAVLRAGVRLEPSVLGGEMPVPSTDDTSNIGKIISPQDEMGAKRPITQGDIAYQQNVIRVYTFSSDKVLASREFVQDSADHGQRSVTQALGGRLGRVLQQKMTVGSGTGEPFGFNARAADSGIDTGGAMTFAHLTALKYQSVDPAYWRGAKPSACWMGDGAAIEAARIAAGAVVGGWEQAVEGDDCDGWLDGHKALINNDCPAGRLFFGDFSYYVMRYVVQQNTTQNAIATYDPGIEIIRAEETFAHNFQFAYYGFVRAGGDLIDPTGGGAQAPLKYLEITA